MDVKLKGVGAPAFGVIEGKAYAMIGAKTLTVPINGKAKADGTFEFNLGMLEAGNWAYSLQVRATSNATSGKFIVK